MVLGTICLNLDERNKGPDHSYEPLFPIAYHGSIRHLSSIHVTVN